MHSLLRGEVSLCLRVAHNSESLSTSQPTCRLPRPLDSARREYRSDGEPGNAAGSWAGVTWPAGHRETLSWQPWLVTEWSLCELPGFWSSGLTPQVGDGERRSPCCIGGDSPAWEPSPATSVAALEGVENLLSAEILGLGHFSRLFVESSMDSQAT